ncbi:MAG: HEPN domain-containing protein [Nanoarchaeota archaeon]|nr:HEPN domain-containing protein [Nanoarchaeota archaeon]MCG2718366.1 HEPN domain-containing protein [Nanoarchaeota archaeon]
MFEPENFLETARQILEDTNYRDESGLRTSMGRAYYAAFHIIKMKLEQHGGHKFKDVHKLHQAVITETVSINSKLGNKINDLFDERVEADYILNANITPGRAQSCIKLAQIIIGSSDILTKK